MSAGVADGVSGKYLKKSGSRGSLNMLENTARLKEAEYITNSDSQEIQGMPMQPDKIVDDIEKHRPSIVDAILAGQRAASARSRPISAKSNPEIESLSISRRSSRAGSIHGSTKQLGSRKSSVLIGLGIADDVPSSMASNSRLHESSGLLYENRKYGEIPANGDWIGFYTTSDREMTPVFYEIKISISENGELVGRPIRQSGFTDCHGTSK
jgi:hypothetical protein